MTTENSRAFDQLEGAPGRAEESDPVLDEMYPPAERGMTRRRFLKFAGAGLLITVLPLRGPGPGVPPGRAEAAVKA